MFRGQIKGVDNDSLNHLRCKNIEHKNELITDVDECAISVVDTWCDPNSLCSDSDPGYTCACNPGYSGPGDVANGGCSSSFFIFYCSI